MADGPGKYDAECTVARESAGIAEVGQIGGVVLIVINGRLGHGFEVQADPLTTRNLPALLEDLAKQIREDMRGLDH